MVSEKTVHFCRRTIEHIHRVQENALYLIENHSGSLRIDDHNAFDLMKNISKHDYSKFDNVAIKAYIEYSWLKFKREEITPEQQRDFDVACFHHTTAEHHHPYNTIWFNNVCTWPNIIEMICDLQAMADEFGEGSCRGYFENVWLKNQGLGAGTTMISNMESIISCFEERQRFKNME